MIFSSIQFFAFLAVVLAALAVSRSEPWRRTILLVASYVFYGAWDWRFCGLILFSTVVDYVIGLRLEASTSPRAKKALLVTSLVANLGLLGVFKYANFFIDSFRALVGASGAHDGLEIILPVGISFYTFQTLSYSIDVYRGRIPATRSFRDFALFVAFFPQLVAGPIVRGSEFLPQLRTVHPLAAANVVTGAERFLRGFVKKVLFADTLAYFADPVFESPLHYATPTCWLAAFAYAGQIYYDFSGYSDMAIGVGRMLGFELPENFAHPYRSRNITEFWRRWHISLSSWLRDYLYIPLGGNRGGKLATYRNLLLTMLLGGLWHGAAWTFVAWGAAHGLALAAHKRYSEARGPRRDEDAPRWRQLAGWLATLVFVTLCWVPFRATSFERAGQMFQRMFVPEPGAHWYYVDALVVLAISAAIHVAVVLRGDRDVDFTLRTPRGFALAVLALLAVLLFGPLDVTPFIYFQF